MGIEQSNIDTKKHSELKKLEFDLSQFTCWEIISHSLLGKIKSACNVNTGLRVYVNEITIPEDEELFMETVRSVADSKKITHPFFLRTFGKSFHLSKKWPFFIFFFSFFFFLGVFYFKQG